MKLNQQNKSILYLSFIFLPLVWSFAWPILFFVFFNSILVNKVNMLVETIIGFVGHILFQSISLYFAYSIFAKSKSKKYFIISIFLIPSLITFILFINAIANLLLIIWYFVDKKEINNGWKELDGNKFYSLSIYRSIYFFVFYLSMLLIFLYRFIYNKEIWDGSEYWINGFGLGALIKLSIDQIIDSIRVKEIRFKFLILNYFLTIGSFFYITIWQKSVYNKNK